MAAGKKISQLEQKTELSGSELFVVADKNSNMSVNSETIKDFCNDGNIKEVRVNGNTLQIAQNIVDILIKSGKENGCISVQDVDIPVKGLMSLAYKSKISISDLSDALEKIINDKAENSEVISLKDEIDTLNGEGTGSIKEYITEAINDFSTKITDDGVVNSYKELIDWVSSHGSEASEFASSIQRINDLLSGIGGEKEPKTVKSAISDQINGLYSLLLPKIQEKVSKEDGKGLSTEDYTTEEKTKLSDLPDKSELQNKLGEKADKTEIPEALPTPNKLVIKTKDEDFEFNGEEEKEINLTPSLIDAYSKDEADTKFVEKEDGKQLSEENFTSLEKTKLSNLPTNESLVESLGEKQGNISTTDDLDLSEENLLSLTNMAKKRLFIDEWNKVCGAFGSYDPDNAPDSEHPFLLNDVWLTYEEAIEILIISDFTSNNINGAYSYNNSIRTLLPRRIRDVSASAAWHGCSNLETLRFTDGLFSTLSNAFYNCPKLKSINLIRGNIALDNAFKKCYALETLYINNLNRNVSLEDSPLITLDSLTYIVNNASNTTSITVTVHPDVYAKLIGNETSDSYSNLTDEEKERWTSLLSLALSKNISFATI